MQITGCIDEWMGVWMDGWINSWIERQLFGQMDLMGITGYIDEFDVCGYTG